jgi:hypothetical protein
MSPHNATQVYCLGRPLREGDLRRLIKAVWPRGAKVTGIEFEFKPDGQIKLRFVTANTTSRRRPPVTILA